MGGEAEALFFHFAMHIFRYTRGDECSLFKRLINILIAGKHPRFADSRYRLVVSHVVVDVMKIFLKDR